MKTISGSKARFFSTVRGALLLSAFFLCSVLLSCNQGQPGSEQAGSEPAASQQRGSERPLPEGPGQEIVQAACVECHTLNRVTRPVGHTPDEWAKIMDDKVKLGIALTGDEILVVTEYLVKNFPDKSIKAVVIPGSVEISIQEWTVPTPGSRPHDPLVAPDGSIWYTGGGANLLGRFDPETAQFKEYPLKTPESGAHGLVADKEGNIWFTAQSGGYIGKLDPKTGQLTEYEMPGPDPIHPHTPLFDQDGILWFTMSADSMVGRLIPETGEVKLFQTPTDDAHPYGMVINSEGIPFFAEHGSNRVGSIDPETMEIREYVLANPDARPRRIAITPDDVLWFSDDGRGTLGRLDPKTGEASEWPSPGGPESNPYGIATVGNIVWYSESGVKPNTVVRFDPETEKFQTRLIPSGGGTVRNMMPSTDGTLWLATSGVNGIARVEVKSN